MGYLTQANEKIVVQKTRLAFLLTSLFNAPFWTLYGMLIFILYKDLHATSLQITLLIALKPVVSLFSIYWSALVHKRPDRLRINVIAAGLMGHFPFFFAPWVDSVWYFIGSGALYLMAMRGIIPAWMEILKRNIPQIARERVFSLGSAISYLGAVVFPLFIGQWMDQDARVWRLFFPLTALLSLAGMIFQWRIPIVKNEETVVPSSPSLKQVLIAPWKNVWTLVKTRKDFLYYQMGFMLGGSGLMIMQPAFPSFFMDFLQLSFTELALAISVSKGIGFALTSRIWAHFLPRTNIYRFSAFVTLLAALFPLGLLMAQTHHFWIYAAYLIYGVMQAGSELSWHLSGPIFSRNEDSSAYSGTNVMTVGIRGCIAPFIGSFLCLQLNSGIVLIIGSLLCILASLQLYSNKRKNWQFESSKVTG
jgi:hypothetical protein